MRTLIVDDDRKLLDLLGRGLADSGFECRSAPDALRAHEVLSEGSGRFDVILLDVMMPGPSGFDFLRELRASGDDTPVIFLTARHEVDERVRGLRLGADDYVVKPFDLSELLARIEAVVRRRAAGRKLSAGPLSLDLDSREAVIEGRPIAVSPQEFDLLRVLAEARGEPLSRRRLLHDVWRIDFEPGTNVVEVQVARLRRKLRRFARPSIETVPGKGYRLVG